MRKNETHSLPKLSNGEASLIFGHNKQIATILDCIKTRKIPNAWLFHGPIGIGKASLALNIAKILSNIDLSNKEHLSCISEKDIRYPKNYFNVNNIFFCKRQWDNEKKLLQKNISIDCIREVSRKLSLSSIDNTYNVCIVDTTEDLNLSASNSLLKILEEPPSKTLFILVSNNKQAILPTIISRCYRIGFQRLPEQNLRDISATLFQEDQFNNLKKAGALTACEGSVRKLINLLDENYIEFFKKMKNLFLNLPTLNRGKAIKLLNDNKEYIVNSDQDKSVMGILLTLLASLARGDINLAINDQLVKRDINLVAAHLYAQISLLRHQSMEYNIDAKKVSFLALNVIESALAKYNKE